MQSRNENPATMNGVRGLSHGKRNDPLDQNQAMNLSNSLSPCTTGGRPLKRQDKGGLSDLKAHEVEVQSLLIFS